MTGLVSTHLALLHRRNLITQKVRIAGQSSLCISVHDDANLLRFFFA
jgi:hypothetical protein